MQDIQAEYRYLPGELLTYVGRKKSEYVRQKLTVWQLSENFSFEPKGKYIIKVCDGNSLQSCLQIYSILEALQKELGLSKKKHTTDDMLFTVETVSCLGARGLAPAMTVNNEVYPSMTPEKALDLIAELRGDNV